jgi:CHAT domain-containing protein
MGVMECYAFIIYSPDSLFNGQEIGHLISMVYYKEVKQLEEEFVKEVPLTTAGVVRLFNLSDRLRDKQSRVLANWDEDCIDSIPPPLDSPEELDLNQIKWFLQQDEVILEYTLSGYALFIFFISKDSAGVCYKTQHDSLPSIIYNYLKKIRSGDVRNLNELQYYLWEQLLQPVEEIIEGKKRLIVIPSQEFDLFPMETLMRTNESYPLLLNFEFVYITSIWKWLHIRMIPHSDLFPSPQSPLIQFVGLAPGFTDYPASSPLPQSATELDDVGLLLERNKISGYLAWRRHAFETMFTYYVSRCHVLHLATHVKPDPNGKNGNYLVFHRSHPAFRDDAIQSVSETAQLKIGADLIVLNTCSSATGPVIPGEGVYSLVRGFLQGGAPHVIGTLWNVSDIHARKLIISFYRHCISGKTFGEALRQAKIEFTKRHETSNPIFWASYLIFGD